MEQTPRVDETHDITADFAVGSSPTAFATDSRSGVGQSGAVKNKREPCNLQKLRYLLFIVWHISKLEIIRNGLSLEKVIESHRGIKSTRGRLFSLSLFHLT